MNDTPETPPLTALWEFVRKRLEGRAGDMWRLVNHIQDHRTAYFLQLGRDGTNMRCLFIPREGEKKGVAQVIMDIGPEDMKILTEFVQAQPDALLCAPLTFPLYLEGNGQQAGEPTTWENGGAVFANSHVVSPVTLNLFERMSPWYVDGLEGIWAFLTKAGEWHRSRAKP
jgi:hypothetical protein